MAPMKGAFVVTAFAVWAGVAAAAGPPRVAHTSEGTKLAQGSLLRVGDFGSGWTSDPASGSSRGISFGCRGFTPKQTDIVEIGTATSPKFNGSEIGPFVIQKTSVYSTPKAANTLWNRGVKPKLAECVAQSLDSLKARGIGVSITSQSRIPLGKIGDHAAGYRVVATLTGKQRLKTYLDVILVGGGRTITELTISNYQKPVPLKWEVALATIAARKLGAGGNVA
jgi:hypothetical protein